MLSLSVLVRKWWIGFCNPSKRFAAAKSPQALRLAIYSRGANFVIDFLYGEQRAIGRKGRQLILISNSIEFFEVEIAEEICRR